MRRVAGAAPRRGGRPCDVAVRDSDSKARVSSQPTPAPIANRCARDGRRARREPTTCASIERRASRCCRLATPNSPLREWHPIARLQTTRAPSHLRVHRRPQLNRVAKALTSQLLPTRHRPRPENHRHASRHSPTPRRGRRNQASTGYTHSSILVTSLATLPLHQRPQCGAQIRMQLVTLDRLADHRQEGDRLRRLAGRVAPAGAVRVSQRRHRVSNHNGLRAPHFEPPKLADPGPGPGPGPTSLRPAL